MLNPERASKISESKAVPQTEGKAGKDYTKGRVTSSDSNNLSYGREEMIRGDSPTLGRAGARSENHANSDEIVIAEIDKNKSQKVRISLRDYRGHKLLSLHVWYEKDGKLFPSDKNVSVNVRLIGDLQEAMIEAAARAKLLGWVS